MPEKHDARKSEVELVPQNERDDKMIGAMNANNQYTPETLLPVFG